MPKENFEAENFTEVQQLIALKRYEQPDDAYFEEFLDEFHRRQRQELLQRSSRSLFFERVSTWFSGANRMRLVYGGGLAYAAVMLGLMLWPKPQDPAQIPTTPVQHVSPAGSPLGQPVDEDGRDMLAPDKDKAPHREAY